jgi:hypothetical protein
MFLGNLIFWNLSFLKTIPLLKPILAMLKLTVLTTRYSWHAETPYFDNKTLRAETVDFDYNTFQKCWNWWYRQQHIPAIPKIVLYLQRHIRNMLKRTFVTTTRSSHAETDNFYHELL